MEWVSQNPMVACFRGRSTLTPVWLAIGLSRLFDSDDSALYDYAVMVKNLKLPFPPLVVVPAPGVVTWEWFEEQVGARLQDGVSVCLVSKLGDDLRGGYFFHVRLLEDGFEFLDFEGRRYVLFPDAWECTTFINHVTGRVYDEEMWVRCRQLNLRLDDEE